MREMQQEVGIPSIFAEMSITGGGAYTINTTGAWHGLIGASADESNGINVITGAIKTDISAYATSDAGARTKVTTAGAHSLSLNDIITITNTTNYNDIYQVMEIIDATNFTIDKAWDTNDDAQGTYALPDHFKVPSDGAGEYQVIWTGSGSIVTSTATCNFAIVVNKVVKHFIGRKFANAADVGAFTGTGMISVPSGNIVWLAIKNLTNTNNIDVDELSFNLHKI